MIFVYVPAFPSVRLHSVTGRPYVRNRKGKQGNTATFQKADFLGLFSIFAMKERIYLIIYIFYYISSKSQFFFYMTAFISIFLQCIFKRLDNFANAASVVALRRD